MITQVSPPVAINQATNRANVVKGTATVQTTDETTILASQAGYYQDVTEIMIANTSATATRVDIRDATAGTVRMSLYIPAGDTRGIVFSFPYPQTAVTNNWTAQASGAVTDLRIFMKGILTL
jgi:hypothetical protein